MHLFTSNEWVPIENASRLTAVQVVTHQLLQGGILALHRLLGCSSIPIPEARERNLTSRWIRLSCIDCCWDVYLKGVTYTQVSTPLGPT